MDNAIIKKEFIRRILVDTSNSITKEQKRRIRKMLNTRTGDLLASKNAGNVEINTDGHFDGNLSLTYLLYERFLDIKKKSSVNMLKMKKSKKKRAFPIHNSVIWGSYERMIYKLSNDFTDFVRQEIVKDLGEAGYK